MGKYLVIASKSKSLISVDFLMAKPNLHSGKDLFFDFFKNVKKLRFFAKSSSLENNQRQRTLTEGKYSVQLA
jgi:hypothetical protein